MDKAPNPPAFPHDEKYSDGRHWYSESGMTLRDYFAGQALPWVLNHLTTSFYPHPAAKAYAIADAMLAERAKATGQEKNDG